MRVKIIVSSLCTISTLLIIALQTLDANTRTVNEKASAAADDEKNLRDLETQWAAAVASNDAARIGRFFSDDFIFVGAGGVLQNRTEHLEDFKSGKLTITSIKVIEIVVHSYDKFAVANTLAA